MAGKILDLADPNVTLPEQIAIDTNVLTTRLIRPRIVSSDHLARLRRVRRFFALLRNQDSLGFVPQTVFQELLHAAIRSKYVGDLAAHGHVIGGKKSWELLFKALPSLLYNYEPTLRRLIASLPILGTAVLQPDDLASLTSGQSFEDELIDIVLRYQLDSNDAAILLEMRRAGLDAIVTEDPDFRRAATDFDIYTWL